MLQQRFWRLYALSGKHVLQLQGIHSGFAFEVIVGHHISDFRFAGDAFDFVFPACQFGFAVEIVVAIGAVFGVEPLIVISSVQAHVPRVEVTCSVASSERPITGWSILQKATFFS